MIASGLASYLLIGLWAALVWLPPAPWRPAAAAAVDAELFECFGTSRTSRFAVRALLALVVVIAWPVYWRASCARRREMENSQRPGPASRIPPFDVG